jgi:hypothetical protein
MPQQAKTNNGWTEVDESASGWMPVETAPPAEPAKKQSPGFFKRLAQGMQLPSSVKELKGMIPKLPDPNAPPILWPASIVAKPIVGYAKNLYSEGKKAVNEALEAGENIGEGGPIKENLGKAAAAGTEFTLKGILAPLGAGALYAWGEDIAGKNYAGAAGDATAVFLNALMLKGTLKPTADVQASKIAYAADIPESMANPKEAIQSVMPEIEAASPKPPTTVGEELEAVNKAKANINSEVGQAMLPISGRAANAIPISDAIKSHITPDMAKTAQGRQMQAELLNAAADYQKPWTFGELHAARINANARLRAFFKKGGTAQYGDMKTDAGVIVDREVARGVQDIVYPEMDKAAGKPAGYFANLLNKQSTLIQLGQALDDNANALAVRTAKIQGAPRLSSENVSAYGHPATTPGISIHRLQNVVVRPNPLGQANQAIARASGSFAGSPVSHAAIYSLPVRYLLLEGQEPPKTPGEAKKRVQQYAPTPQ